MSVHDGHRKRMRQRFLAEGLDQFTDVQILEILLFYCIARQDTNPIAHELLNHFGSLSQVLEAPVEELCKVDGIGENTAVFLKLITQVGRCYLTDRASKSRILPTLDSCAKYLQTFFFGRNVETVYLLCLDAKCKMLCCKKISEGDVNSTTLSVRKIVETALSTNASSVVLAHNHPGGLAVPSNVDVQTTLRIADALQAVDVHFIDHILVTDDDYVSLAQSGYTFPASNG
ncbi:MAG: DNA repair protein RadC [Firmicutes bacterium]|nr:DNA repair protein RadC [Bacillota bacterium]MDY6159384.1 DNA repair protein RadC [Candidatus Faecousia sp.]